MRRIVRAAVLAGLLALASGIWNSARAEELSVITRDGVRSAILLPARRSPAATVVVLHGALISAEQTADWYGFAQAAKRHGLAAVFPRGIDMLWNDGRDGVWMPRVDDVDFLRRLAGDLVALGTADPARLYLVGISNGGMLALRMLCEAPDVFAGVGTIIASMPTAVGDNCRLERPVPVIMFNGTADPLIPYKGGAIGIASLEGSVWPAERTAAFLAKGNGCGPTPEQSVVVSGSGRDPIRIVRFDWGRCSGRADVTLYRVEGGGHQVYGHTNYLARWLGPGTRHVSAPDAIVAALVKSGHAGARSGRASQRE